LSRDDTEIDALPVEPTDGVLHPTTSGSRSAGPRLRATLASYRCTFALEQQDFEAARLEYWVLQQALDEAVDRAVDVALDDEIIALQARARGLARMLALRITPREFKRIESEDEP
jgi:hypothetical protein